MTQLQFGKEFYIIVTFHKEESETYSVSRHYSS
jgi:hypothetical protein